MELLSLPLNTAAEIEPGLVSHTEPRLLLELEPWAKGFFRNLRDTLLFRHPEQPELTSAPGEFWPDVFVRRSLPWWGFFESGFGHGLVFAALWGLAIIWPVRPQLTPERTFDRSQVIYFSPSEYLPPLDTGEVKPTEPQKADPEYARQPILSVPPEADNPHQTIVSPPDIRLTQDIATPNVVSWGDHTVPVPLAATERESPAVHSLTAPIVAPPPDVRVDDSHALASLNSGVIAPAPDLNSRDSRTVQSLNRSIVPPPPDASAARDPRSLQAPHGSIVPPPPIVQLAAQRVGEVSVAPSQIIAPAPQLTVPAQRSVPGLPGENKDIIAPPPSLNSVAAQAEADRYSGGVKSLGQAANHVIPPPPSAAQAGTNGSERLIALGIHPAPVPPPVAPGNRRGSFAATPEGKAGATATPGSTGTHSANSNHDAGKASGSGDASLPRGLQVGAVPQATASATSGKSSSDLVNPNLFARALPPAASLPSSSRVGSSDDVAKTPLEQRVFGDRHVYSLTLNMPNLNSAGGSWVIRFAEANSSAPKGDFTTPVAVHKVDPAYPLELMRKNVAGTVTLQAVIAADGSVEKVQVLQGVDEQLDRFACDAFRRWRFFPATRNGNPVDLDAVVTIPFHPFSQRRNF